MITFKYTDENTTHRADVEVATPLEHLENIVAAFRAFLLHIGHHPENVERVVLEGKETHQPSPQQLELPL